MADPRDVQELVRDVANRLRERRVSVAVVGDMILDTAIEGNANGVHPEAGVPVLREATIQESIGGAANTALVLTRLGVDVTLFGVIGSDLAGRQLENLLERQPFANFLVTERGWQTPRKDWIYRPKDGNFALLQRIDYDRPLPAIARQELVRDFEVRCPPNVDVVILEDHGLGCIGPESLPVLDLARQRQAKVAAIPRSPALHGQPLDGIIINIPEMCQLCGAPETADARLLAASYAREYAQDVFLSLLEEGLLVCPARSLAPGTLVPGYSLDNPQWMGARGMTAALVAVGMALGLSPLDNARVANVFRHLVAGQRGNGRVLWRDVFHFVGVAASNG